MPHARPRVLYVSDLGYEAQGRRYCDEDIFLSSRLRASFDVAVCHPLDAARLMGLFDLVMVRNSGPVVRHLDEYDDFRARAAQAGVLVYNQLSGKADMLGKQYLLDLTAAGFPVIPTIEHPRDLRLLPAADGYVVKPVRGADSVGLRFVTREHLADIAYDDVIVQPRVDFAYEVSFYFIDHDFQYALHAPVPDRRWALERYEPDAADLAFAQRFIDWNDIEHGIQRVDACRTSDGDLLLVELEDLNPYLSLERLDVATREEVVADIERSVCALLREVPAR